MVRKGKKPQKRDNSKDNSDTLITDETSTKNEKSDGSTCLREKFNGTNELQTKQTCCCFTCGCLVATLLVSLIISIAFPVNCDTKDTNCNANATSANNKPHHSNRAENSKMQEYNALHPELATYGYNTDDNYPKKVPSPAIYSGENYGLAYYNRYHGFKIRRSIFHYNGIGYKLTCNKTRFYRLWCSCYGKYHSKSRCFERFRKQRLFLKHRATSYRWRSKIAQ
ncbi:uncharacterized protein LOC134708000 isoform X2 [Mytilus trossulus]|uniref:uncharacterized protein LOC134708000 isoform X2 n=1 Tax=Mytilus trossulus TaxID=6551 RepID=UPI003007B885